jgi:hypothetical protein
MVRQQEKCVTGIVRKPFGGGGAFVVAEGHGTDGTSSVLGFDLLQISSSPTHARLPGREEPGEPVQALSQAHSRKGLRSRASLPLAWFSGRWCAAGCDDYCCVGGKGSSWVCQIDEARVGMRASVLYLSWAGEDSSLRIDRLGARLVGIVGQLAVLEPCWL